MGARTWSPAVAALLVAMALAVLPPPASGHPYHLQLSNNTLASPEEVDSVRTVAQSFIPSSAFSASRISLYVSDIGGSDTLTVSIRTNVAGFPGDSDLASGSADGPATPGWLDLDLTPYVQLSAGQIYWIVARSGAISAQGYQWWNSGDDLAYGLGTAAIYDGSSWSGAGKDYSFRVYGFFQPNLAFAITTSDATLRPGQQVAFRIFFNNSGAGDAANLWVNITLPAELTYVGDDAATAGGVRSGTYTFAFANVAPGAHSFNLTASARGGVAEGATVSVPFTFDGQDHNGAALPRESRGVAIDFKNAQLSLTIAANATVADPGDEVVMNVTVANTGSGDATAVTIVAYLDPNLTYVSSSPLGTYNGTSRTIQWSLPTLVSGSQTSFAWTAGVALGTPGGNVATRVQATYRDTTSTALPPVEANGTLGGRAPAFSPVLLLDRAVAERGEVVSATVYHNNTGSAPALRAWANFTLGGHYRLVDLTPAMATTPLSDGFSVALTNVAPGPHSLVARLEVLRSLQDGLAMGLQLHWAATDGNGNPLPGGVLNNAATLRAPSVAILLVAPSSRVGVGSTFTLEVTVNNTGSAASRGWLNVTLPQGVAYVGDNGTYVATQLQGGVSWFIPSLAPRSSFILSVTLRAPTAAGTEAFRFAFALTDSAGSGPVEVLSNGLPMEFVAVPAPEGPVAWWWLVPVGAGIATGALLLRRRGKIEEIFLVHYAGTLMAHVSRTLTPMQDRDILTAMLTAVQDFIREAFVVSKEGELRHMDFGNHKITIQRGVYGYLAVITAGRPPAGLPRKMKLAMVEIEGRLGPVISTWEGDVDSLKGAYSILNDIFMKGGLRQGELSQSRTG